MATILALQAYNEANAMMIFALANKIGGADIQDVQEQHKQFRKQALEESLRRWEDRNPAVAARLQEQFNFLDDNQ